MKKLTCELCGSVDFVKQDGVFVCQSCGTKYSLEEAKKMMIDSDDRVPVESNVKATNSDKASNLLQLARRAKDSNDAKTASKYYGDLLLEDPNNWEAAYYAIYYDAMNVKIAEIGNSAYRVRNCLPNVTSLIKQYVPKEHQVEAYEELVTSATRFAWIMYENAEKSIKSMPSYDIAANTSYDNHKDLTSLMTAVSRQLSAKEDLFEKGSEWLAPIMSLMLDLAERTEADEILAISAAYKLYEDAQRALKSSFDILTISDTVFSDGSNGLTSSKAGPYNEVGMSITAKLAEMKDAIAAEKKRKIQAYWAEHAEEKQTLETKKQDAATAVEQLSSQISNRQEEINDLDAKIKKLTSPLEAELNRLTAEISKLRITHKSLGLFKGKEKKQIEEKIAQLEAEKPTAQAIEAEKSSLKAPIEKQKATIQAEIKAMEEQCQIVRKELADAESQLSREIE